jgi:hypothetical protein
MFAKQVPSQWVVKVSKAAQKKSAATARTGLSEYQGFSMGQELLSLLGQNEQHPSSASSESPAADACFGDVCNETDVKVVIKHGFIEVKDPQCAGRRRTMSDSALVLTSDRERTWHSQPLPTVPDLSDASTTDNEGPEESQPEDLNVNLAGVGAVRKDTCWSDDEGWDMQQQYMPYQYDATWWIPMCCDADGNMCPAMTDGTEQIWPQVWADQSIECEAVDTELATDQEWRTTVMLRNMPNNYTRDMLLDLVDSMGFEGCYDFAYLPVDFKSQAGLGYAFINFVTSVEAQRCFDQFEGFSEWKVPSEKVCTVTWGSPYQGLEAHVERYQNSPVMHHSIPDEWKPVLFDEQGVRVPFPAPTKAIKTPKVRAPPATN